MPKVKNQAFLYNQIKKKRNPKTYQSDIKPENAKKLKTRRHFIYEDIYLPADQTNITSQISLTKRRNFFPSIELDR